MQSPFVLLAFLLSLFSMSLASIPEDVSFPAEASLLPRQSLCQTPGFVPCNPPGSAGSIGVPPAAFNAGGSGFWSSLQSAASSPIQKVKREIEGGLEERQSGGLCCRPAPVECLYTKDQGVPFCYVSLLFPSSPSKYLTSIVDPRHHPNVLLRRFLRLRLKRHLLRRRRLLCKLQNRPIHPC